MVLMNPPYGGSEKESVKVNFPTELRKLRNSRPFYECDYVQAKKNGRLRSSCPTGSYLVLIMVNSTSRKN